jgi:hypothetical protein
MPLSLSLNSTQNRTLKIVLPTSGMSTSVVHECYLRVDKPDTRAPFSPRQSTLSLQAGNSRASLMFIMLLPMLLRVSEDHTLLPSARKLTYRCWTDFRVIPLGDLNLLQEIGIHRGADVVHRKNGGNSARKMYTARVHGYKSNMTVALYQGDGAEDVGFLYS